jgi:alcohol dehydrogenase, propanol-preferring
MKALQLVAWEAAPELREVERPSPGPGEVVLKVDAAGLCHSDLHVMDWPAGTLPWELPLTLGHEVAGTVAEIGRGVTGFAEDDRVVVYGPWGCGTCRHCVRGAENYCECIGQLGGLGRPGLGADGGLAEYMLVPATRWLVPIGDLDPLAAAPLADAGLTPYHAIQPELWRLRPGSTAVVIGVGGLGHLAVQILRALTPARIVAVDPRESSRRLALDAGVDAALDAVDPAELRAEIGGVGADLVLDFVVSDDTVPLAAAALAVAGHVALVGLGGGTFPIGFGHVPFGASAGRPSWGTLPELHEVIALARAGALRVETERLTLADAADGYRRLRDGDVVGRAVVVP